MKKIGFIDLYISEWHANNYPKWIKKAADALGEEWKVAYVYAEEDVSPVDGRTTAAWCEAFSAKVCASIREVCERSDYLFILAPSNPEKHLAYVREVFPFAKPTYVDKTFAPNAAEAEEIFALAEKYGTPFFSTSALRYATELADIPAPRELAVTGGGSNFPEYSVHQVEMIVKLMGGDFTDVSAEKTEDGYAAAITFADGRHATVSYAPTNRFTVTADGVLTPIASDFFGLLLADIVRFFREGTVAFDTAETLAVMRLREAILGKAGLV